MSVIKTRSLDHFFIFKESEKSLTMDSVRNILLDQFNECERIRSLDDLFNFRESEKSLTMDSVGVSFSYVQSLKPKKGIKLYLRVLFYRAKVPQSTPLFVQLTVRTEKGVNYRQTNVTSNFSLTSVKGHKITRQYFHVQRV